MLTQKVIRSADVHNGFENSSMTCAKTGERELCSSVLGGNARFGCNKGIIERFLYFCINKTVCTLQMKIDPGPSKIAPGSGKIL